MNQTNSILKHLQKGKALTAIQALEKFGCFRLAARISDLKQLGYSIVSERIESDGKYFAKYSLK